LDPVALLQELVEIPGPPGQEEAIAEAVAFRAAEMGFDPQVDAKGNVRVAFGRPPYRIVVTAHLDEIAMMVREIEPSGQIVVGSLGGLYPWKLGEGPVQVLASDGAIDGVLGFGSIHTEDAASRARRAAEGPVKWSHARVETYLSPSELVERGVRPGTRVVIHPMRRRLLRLGDLVAGPFLDDRADLVSMLLALDELKASPVEGVLFAATASEEVGGEGARWIMGEVRPEVCIALELGPAVTDAPVALTADPTVWTTDGYASMSAADGDLVARVARGLGIRPQWQALSRGGSDASCCAQIGLTARPITLGLPMQNSHGYETMHTGAMSELARLTVGLLREL
jgi:putative aminopeptidase FrvX